MSKPIGYYTEDGKRKPIHAPTSKRGYNQKPRQVVRHESKYTREEVARINANRSIHARNIDNSLRARTAQSNEEWVSNPNRTDLPWLDAPVWMRKSEIEKKIKDSEKGYVKEEIPEGHWKRKREYLQAAEEYDDLRASGASEAKLEEAYNNLNFKRDSYENSLSYLHREARTPERKRFDELTLVKGEKFTTREGSVEIDKVNPNSVWFVREDGTRFKEDIRTAKQMKDYSNEIKQVKKRDVSASYNKSTGWLQVKFDEKPDDSILQELKSVGFQYRPGSRTWAAKWNTTREDTLKQIAGSVDLVDVEVDYARKAEIAEQSALRHAEKAEDYRDRRDNIAKVIPLGQPILVGHHSEKKHRRDLERMSNYTKKAIEEDEITEKYARRADRYEQLATHGENPATTYNRIKKLESDERRFERELKRELSRKAPNKSTVDWAERNLKHTHERLEIERTKYEVSGGIVADQIILKKGDIVDTRLGKATILKVNKATVKVNFHNPALKSWDGYNLDKTDITNKI